MPKKRTEMLETLWRDFFIRQRHFSPSDISDAQHAALRRVYYAGAFTMFEIMTHKTMNDVDTVVGTVNDLKREFDYFVETELDPEWFIPMPDVK